MISLKYRKPDPTFQQINLHQETLFIRGLNLLAHRLRAEELLGLFSTAPELLARRFCLRYGPDLAILLSYSVRSTNLQSKLINN